MVAISAASHNDLLIGLLDGLWDKADRYRRAALEAREDSPDDRARVQAEHRAMMTAVLDGDPDSAEEHMGRHVANSLGRRAIDILTAN
jgi:DNA-binding FadR family transcriptional regulator